MAQLGSQLLKTTRGPSAPLLGSNLRKPSVSTTRLCSLGSAGSSRQQAGLGCGWHQHSPKLPSNRLRPKREPVQQQQQQQQKHQSRVSMPGQCKLHCTAANGHVEDPVIPSFHLPSIALPPACAATDVPLVWCAARCEGCRE